MSNRVEPDRWNRIFVGVALAMGGAGAAWADAPASGPPTDPAMWQVKPEHEHIHGPGDPNSRAWPFMAKRGEDMGPYGAGHEYVMLFDRGTTQSNMAFSDNFVDWQDDPENPIFDQTMEKWQGHRAWMREIVYVPEESRYVALVNGANPDAGIRAAGLFESTDFRNWQPVRDAHGNSVNPIATVNDIDMAGGNRVYGAWLGQENGTWYMVAQAERNTGQYDFVPTLMESSNLVDWEESSSSPLLMPELAWEGDRVRTQGITYHEGTYWMIYENEHENMWGMAHAQSITGEWTRIEHPVLLAEDWGGYEKNIGSFEGLIAPTSLLKTSQGWSILAAGIYGEGISPTWGEAEITLITTVPEPGTLAVLGAGAGLLLLRRQSSTQRAEVIGY